MYPFIYTNVRGIAEVASSNVEVGTTEVTFTFPNHAFARMNYRGWVTINLAQTIPSGTTSTLPIVFNTNGSSINLTTKGGTNATVADITGTGYYLVYYDKSTNTLQLS